MPKSLKERVRQKPPKNPTKRLTIELVPQTSWFNNVRSIVTQEEWNHIRKFIYQRAGYVCEICGGRGSKHPVECHEVWKFEERPDNDSHLQTLVDLIALCPACHQVKHIGLSLHRGLGEQATRHLMYVNGMTEDEAYAYIQEAFRIWEERSNHQWEVDISRLGAILKSEGL